MTRGGDFERLLRWYPAAWRRRYGAELVALLEDTYPDGPVSWRCRVSLLGAGLAERLRAAGLAGAATPPPRGVRAGSLLVLWAWAIFMVAGTGFAKLAENWPGAVPARSAALPTIGYNVAFGAGVVGVLIVALAAATCLPSVVSLLRAGGWRAIRRPVGLAAALTGTVIAVVTALAVWGHQLGSPERNGGLWTYSALFVTAALAFTATISAWTAAATAAARRIEFRARVLRRCWGLAVSLTVVMAALTAGTLAWWGAVAARVPWFLAGTAPGTAGTVAPLLLAAIGTLMIIGLFLAILGARRATLSLRRLA